MAVELFHPRLVLTCSWQKQSSVLVHMVSEIQPDVRVVEFDTGLLFRETYETRQKLIERYPVRFERIQPELTVEEQAAKHGDRLWERDPDALLRACARWRRCGRRWTALDAWITGIRRDQSTTRESARKIEMDERRGVVKVQPLADWTSRDVWRYIWRHGIPYNPLHDHGYPSIGCVPCTASVDERRRTSGRAAGRAPARSSAASTATRRLQRVKHDTTKGTITRAERQPLASPSGSPDCPAPARAPSPRSSARSWSGAASWSTTWTATSSAPTSARASASRGRTATPTSCASASSRSC